MNQVSIIPSHKACFVCGRLNVNGLGLIFETAGDRIRCRTTLDSKYQSYDGIVHGGILASIADATMVNLVYRQHGGRPLTCKLMCRFSQSWT
jgi:acyl-coenzyme A thioesterase PaaI-like protein